MQRTITGRARIALGHLREHPIATTVWVIAVALMFSATFNDNANLARWAVLTALIANALTFGAIAKHAVARLTQIMGYFHDNVERGDDEGRPPLRSIPCK